MISQFLTWNRISAGRCANNKCRARYQDHQHRMVRLIQEGRLGLAPVRNARNVIDVCTGTGIWATEYGKFATSLSLCLIFFV